MIHAEKAKYPVTLMCRQLAVTPSGYYAWKNRSPSKRKKRDAELVEKIQASHKSSQGSYGSPRIYDDLKDQGETAGRHRIARLMRENDITAQPKKRFRKTTDSNHTLPVAPNLLNRKFDTEAPDQAWVSDITYVWTIHGWAYLAVIIDLFSRRVVGWSLENHMRTELVLKALKMAKGHRKIPDGLIFHSDRGVQYASNEFRAELSKNGIEQSMSRKGNCWDNAVAESFFATIKRELVRKHLWLNLRAARIDIHKYTEVFYNRKRKHSTIGYFNPVDYERYFENHAAVAA